MKGHIAVLEKYLRMLEGVVPGQLKYEALEEDGQFDIGGCHVVVVPEMVGHSHSYNVRLAGEVSYVGYPTAREAVRKIGWFLFNRAMKSISLDGGVSDEDIQRYISSGGTECPVCRYEHLQGGPIEVNGGTCDQEMQCPECESFWKDVYTLTCVSNLCVGD